MADGSCIPILPSPNCFQSGCQHFQILCKIAADHIASRYREHHADHQQTDYKQHKSVDVIHYKLSVDHGTEMPWHGRQLPRIDHGVLRRVILFLHPLIILTIYGRFVVGIYDMPA